MPGWTRRQRSVIAHASDDTSIASLESGIIWRTTTAQVSTGTYRTFSSDNGYVTLRYRHRRFTLLLLCLFTVLYGKYVPSYTHPPTRYTSLRQTVESDSSQGGRATSLANKHAEKVFIAAVLYDGGGTLLSGRWGEHLLDLINIIGPEHVHLSIYENDPDPGAEMALYDFATRVTCESTLVAEHLDVQDISHVRTQDGTQSMDRIAFLAEVRNRALRPLRANSSMNYATRFDKVLYLNDVYFDPIDAANLLFSTNVREATGRTDYRAVCAIDFKHPMVFYDTFATRDADRYEVGAAIFPWFSNAGSGRSRQDVLSQSEIVRVKSCWSGMVAFEAKWFQPEQDISGSRNSNMSGQTGLGFRYEQEDYWDASECCLIHADLAAFSDNPSTRGETGIYINPFVRVAYSRRALAWLPYVKFFERLLTPIQTLLTSVACLPRHNPRRLERLGETVTDEVWIWDDDPTNIRKAIQHQDMRLADGLYKNITRTASSGGFCGHRKQSVIIQRSDGVEKGWASLEAPALA
ncbi:hypothetical protein KCU99_g634, partial [Aureobasidium melanogenum]